MEDNKDKKPEASKDITRDNTRLHFREAEDTIEKPKGGTPLDDYIKNLKNRAKKGMPDLSPSKPYIDNKSTEGASTNNERINGYVDFLSRNKTKSYDNPMDTSIGVDYGVDITNNKYLPGSYSYLSPYNVGNVKGHGQSRGRKALYGVGRAANTAILEGVRTAGVIGGLGVGATMSFVNAVSGNWEDNDFFGAVFNNPLVNAATELQEYIDEEVFPVHFRQAVQDGNIWEQLSSMESWATTGAAMAGFATMMYGPGAIFNYARVGDRLVNAATSVRNARRAAKLADTGDDIAKGAKTLETMGKSMNFGSKAGRYGAPTTPQMINRWGETLTSIIADAGNEAMTAADMYEQNQLERLHRGEINQAEFDELIEENKYGKVARGVFLSNVPIQMGPKFIMSKLLWGGTRTGRGAKFIDRQASNEQGKIVVKDLTSRMTAAEVGKGIASGAARSTYELPTQTASREIYIDNPDAGLGEFFSSLVPAYLDAIGTDETKQAIFFGQMSSIGASTRSRYRGVKATHKATSDLANVANNGFTSLSKNFNADVFIRDNEGNIKREVNEDGSIRKDEDGSDILQIDSARLEENIKILNELGFAGEKFEEAVMNGDELTVEYLRHMAQMNLLNTFIHNDVLGIDLLRESLAYSDQLEGFAEEKGMSKSEVIEDFVRKANYLRDQSKVFDDYGESVLRLTTEEGSWDEVIAPHYESIKGQYLALMHNKLFFDDQLSKMDSSLARVLKDFDMTPSEFQEYQTKLIRNEESILKGKEAKIDDLADRFNKVNEYKELLEKISEGAYKDIKSIGLSFFINPEILPDGIGLTSEELGRFRELFMELNREALPEAFIQAYEAGMSLELDSETGEVTTNISRTDTNKDGSITYNFRAVDENGKVSQNRGKEYKSIEAVEKDLLSLSNKESPAPISRKSISKLAKLMRKAESTELMSLNYSKDGKSASAVFNIDGVNHTIDGLPISSKFNTNEVFNRRRVAYRMKEISRKEKVKRAELEKLENTKDRTTYQENLLESTKKEIDSLLEEHERLKKGLHIEPRHTLDMLLDLHKEEALLQTEIGKAVKAGVKKIEEENPDLAKKYKNLDGDARVAKHTANKSLLENSKNDNLERIKDFWNPEKQQEAFDKKVESMLDKETEAKEKEAKEIADTVSKIRKATTLDELSELVGDSKSRKIRHEAKLREKAIKKEMKEATAERVKQQKEESKENVVRNETESETTNTDPVSVVESTAEDGDPARLDPNTLYKDGDGSTNDGNPVKGGTRIIGLNNDGTKPDFISQKFVDWQLEPRDKTGDTVSFEPNNKALETVPKTHENYNKFKEATELANSIIDGAIDTRKLTEAQLELLVDYLPINAVVAEGVSAPIATRPVATTNNAQAKFDAFDRTLRVKAIDHLIANKSLDGFTTVIEGQYRGAIKTSPNPRPGMAAVNSLYDLYEFRDKKTGEKLGKSEILSYIRENLFHVNNKGYLVDSKGVRHPGLNWKGNIPKGEMYLMLTASNGKKMPVKMNTERLADEHAGLVADIYEIAVNENLSIHSNMSDISDKATYNKLYQDFRENLIPGKLSNAKDIYEITGKRKKDLTLNDIVTLFTTPIVTNEKTGFEFEYVDNGSIRAGFKYGQNYVPLKENGSNKFNRDDFKEWILNNKRYAVNITPPTPMSKARIGTSSKYLEWVVDNKMLNTNGVVNEPLFSDGYTGVYLSNPHAKSISGSSSTPPSTQSSPASPTAPPTTTSSNSGLIANNRIAVNTENVKTASSIKDGEVELKRGNTYNVSYVGSKAVTLKFGENNQVTHHYSELSHPMARVGLREEAFRGTIDTSNKVNEESGLDTTRTKDGQSVVYVVRQDRPHVVTATGKKTYRGSTKNSDILTKSDFGFALFGSDAEANAYFSWLKEQQSKALDKSRTVEEEAQGPKVASAEAILGDLAKHAQKAEFADPSSARNTLKKKPKIVKDETVIESNKDEGSQAGIGILGDLAGYAQPAKGVGKGAGTTPTKKTPIPPKAELTSEEIASRTSKAISNIMSDSKFKAGSRALNSIIGDTKLSAVEKLNKLEELGNTMNSKPPKNC